MNHTNKNMLRLGVVSIIIIVSLLMGLVFYYDSLVLNLEQSTCKTLNEVMKQGKNNFTNTLNTDKEVLKGYAKLIAQSEQDEQGLVEIMEVIVESTSFEYIFLADKNGVSINNLGGSGTMDDRDYFYAALAGETVISEPVGSKLRDAYVIAVSTPVVEDDEIIGVLVGSFNAEKLNNQFTTSFNGFGYTYIATNDGELIAKTESEYMLVDEENLFETYKKAEFNKNDSYESMRENLVEGKGGHSQYKIGGQRRLMHYDKLPVNDWNIFSVVNANEVEATANVILTNAILLIFALVAIFVGLLVYIFRSQKRFTRKLTKMAYVDDITGKRSFGKFKIDAAALIQKNTGTNYIIIKMDIENFKLINEIYSMEMGDRILKAEADALALALDADMDAFGRIHADEFVMLVSYATEEEYKKKRQLFEEQFMQSYSKLIDFKLILPRGRYRIQTGENDFNQIYEKVNFAHRHSKNSDGNELDFDGHVKERAIREKEIESKMEDALLGEEYKLFLQPKYRLEDERIVGAEALVRWVMQDGKMIYPDEFIPLFEQNGFITRLDLYMFDKACAVLRKWTDSGITPIPISVNFSRLHLRNENFVEELCVIADRHKISHNLLEIELTETTMLESLDILEEVLEKIHKADFTLSMDDFGTGYSSLGLLKNICVDVIKIDKGFFDQSKDLQRTKTVISSVIDMAQKLGIHTVAEGVETKENVFLLWELGCETVQGYYFARPMPVEHLEAELTENLLASQ